MPVEAAAGMGRIGRESDESGKHGMGCGGGSCHAHPSGVEKTLPHKTGGVG